MKNVDLILHASSPSFSDDKKYVLRETLIFHGNWVQRH